MVEFNFFTTKEHKVGLTAVQEKDCNLFSGRAVEDPIPQPQLAAAGTKVRSCGPLDTAEIRILRDFRWSAEICLQYYVTSVGQRKYVYSITSPPLVSVRRHGFVSLYQNNQYKSREKFISSAISSVPLVRNVSCGKCNQRTYLQVSGLGNRLSFVTSSTMRIALECPTVLSSGLDSYWFSGRLSF